MRIAQRIQAYSEHRLQSMGQHRSLVLDGFTLYLHNSDPSFDANLAVPSAAAAEGAELERALAAVRASCTQHQRAAHIRFLDQAAPALRKHLDAAGARCQAALPVMLATAASLSAPPQHADLAIEILTRSSPLEAIRTGLDVNAQGFDPSAPPATDEEAAAFRAGLIDSCAFTLRYRGQPASAGMYTPIHAGVTELVGIATLEPFRRRGLARYLTAFMAHTARQAGAELVHLVAVSQEATQVYRQAGFRLGARRLSYRLDSA